MNICTQYLSQHYVNSSHYHYELVHGEGAGAKWLRWVIFQLYPVAASGLNGKPSKPPGSPKIEDVNVSIASDKALNGLVKMKEKEPAGNKPSTLRLNEAMATGVFVE